MTIISTRAACAPTLPAVAEVGRCTTSHNVNLDIPCPIREFRIVTVLICPDITRAGSPKDKNPAAYYRNQRNEPVESRFSDIVKAPPPQSHRRTQSRQAVYAQRNIVMPFAGKSPDKNKYHSHDEIKQNKIPVFAPACAPFELKIL